MTFDRMRHLTTIVSLADQLPTESLAVVVTAVKRAVGALTEHAAGRAYTLRAPEDAVLELGDAILAARPMAAVLEFGQADGDPIKLMLAWRPIEGLSLRINSETRISRLRLVLTEVLGVLRLPMSDADRVATATSLIVQALALGTCDREHAPPACGDPGCVLGQGSLS